jgi:hypothetical protein
MIRFTLVQNNSGGFHLADMPLSMEFIAVDRADAEAQAEALGVDFSDGCVDCCGARWNFVRHFADAAEEALAREDFTNQLRALANR